MIVQVDIIFVDSVGDRRRGSYLIKKVFTRQEAIKEAKRRAEIDAKTNRVFTGKPMFFIEKSHVWDCLLDE